MIEELKLRKFRNRLKIYKTLKLAMFELDFQVGYYVTDRICDKLNMPVPPVKRIVEILKEKGLDVSLTSFNSKGVKVNIPATDLTEIFKEFT